MDKLSNPQKTIEVIQKYHVNFQKKFGQNFLIDPRVLDRIVEAADIGPEDCVLEIGPGIGTLTQYLSESARRVIAVEIDRNLIPVLEDTLQGYDNVTVIHGDILKTDIAELAQLYNDGCPLKVVANLPYYITTPIIMGIFEKHAPVSSITVMIQKEVADRMQAEPGTKDYGALSLAVQYYSRPRICANVPPNCFIPRPGVGSAVIHLDCSQRPQVETDERLMFAIIHAAFAQRRKTLANCLKNALDPGYSREETEAVLAVMGLSPGIRGEVLTLSQFAQLTRLLGEQHRQQV